MAVAYDAFSSATAGTGTLSWTHTPSGTPKGVFVWVCAPTSTADQVTGVTYGGVSMTEISAGPVVRDGGETSVMYGYFLGSGLGTGAQTVEVSVSGSALKYAWATTVTAAADTELEAFAYEPTTSGTNIVANPDVSLALGGETCFVAIGWSSGLGGVADTTPRSGWTQLYEVDTGTQLVGCYSYDTIGSADVTAGYDAAADDASIIAVAIREAAGGGFTLALDAGSYTYTGQDTGLVVSRKLAFNAGSYAYTGQTTTLSYGRKLSLDAGSYTITGNDVTLTYTSGGVTYTLDLDAGSYTYTGQTTDFKVSRKLSFDAGVYSYTGQTTGLAYSGATGFVTIKAGSWLRYRVI